MFMILKTFAQWFCFLKVILHKASIVGTIFSDMQKDVFLIDIMACCNHSHPCYSHKSEAVRSHRHLVSLHCCWYVMMNKQQRCANETKENNNFMTNHVMFRVEVILSSVLASDWWLVSVCNNGRSLTHSPKIFAEQLKENTCYPRLSFIRAY